MKKSVGILKGKKLVIGEENLVTKNEILLKKKEDSLELSIRANDEMKVISGGSSTSSEDIEYLSYMISTNSNEEEKVEYFLFEKYAILGGSNFPDNLKELTYIDPNELVISQYPKSVEVGARNPYIYLFSHSNNSKVVDSVSFHYNKLDGSEGTLSSKCSKVFYIDTRDNNYVILKEEYWSRDLSINSTFPHIIVAITDSKNNLIMLIGRHYSGEKMLLKSLFDKLEEMCGIKVDYSNMKSASYT